MISNLEKIETYSIPHTISDLGEISFLKLKGISHSKLILNGNEVLFFYDQDLNDILADYWSDQAKVPPRLFKTTIDSYKRLVFSFLRSKGVR